MNHTRSTAVCLLLLLIAANSTATTIRGSSGNGGSTEQSVWSTELGLTSAALGGLTFNEQVYCTDAEKTSSGCLNGNYGFLYQFASSPGESVTLEFQNLITPNTSLASEGFAFEVCDSGPSLTYPFARPNFPTLCTNPSGASTSGLSYNLPPVTFVSNGTTLTLTFPDGVPLTLTVGLYETQNVDFNSLNQPTLSATVPEPASQTTLLSELIFLGGIFCLGRKKLLKLV